MPAEIETHRGFHFFTRVLNDRIVHALSLEARTQWPYHSFEFIQWETVVEKYPEIGGMRLRGIVAIN